MDFLSNAWNTVKGAASDVWDWATRSPIEDFKAGYRWGQSVQQQASTAVTTAAKTAGRTLGTATSGFVWEALLPLVPIIVIAGAAWYFVRRRGA